MGLHPAIDLSQLIGEKIANIKITRKIIENDRLKLRIKFGNGREKEIELKRFVNAIDLAFCVGMFSGDGTKSGGRGFPFEFTNSNPRRIKKMINFLQNLGVKKGEIKLRLQIRCRKEELERGLIKELESFWSRFLNIPLQQFEKPNVRIANKSRRSKFGTIRLRVNSNFLAKLFLELEKFMLADLPQTPAAGRARVPPKGRSEEG